MQKKVIVRAASLVFSGLLVAVAANAAEQTTVPATQANVSVQGVQVAIDPTTGRLVAPTAAQRSALSRAMVQDANSAGSRKLATGQAAIPRNELEARATFHRITLKNGHRAVGMAVPETLMSSLVAERDAAGNLSIHHAGDTAPTKAVEVSR